MKSDYCPGCGLPLQTTNPKAPGYVPEFKEGKNLICQRCYRISHYGKLTEVKIPEGDLRRVIRTATGRADLTLLVADFFDPEGSFAPHWEELIQNRVILLVNKADLIPPRTPRPEIEEWFSKRWQKQFPRLPLAGVMTVSARDVSGMSELRGILRGKKAAVAGAANVGKSSLLSRLLKEESGHRRPERNPRLPTVSPFPGTTQGITFWSLKETGSELFDTPGLIPDTRMGDRLCPVCAGRLLPKRELQIKVWDVSPGEAVLFGELAAVWNLSSSARTMVFFAAESVKLHKTKGEKAERLLREAPEWLRGTCPQDAVVLTAEQIIRDWEVHSGEDLFISGLGWAAVKKETANLRAVVPERVETGVRPSLIGKK